jgi:hypothetical protein
MRSPNLSADQIAGTIEQLMIRVRKQTRPEEWDAVEEAMHRVREYERLVQDVLPDLRNRIPQMKPGQ